MKVATFFVARRPDGGRQNPSLMARGAEDPRRPFPRKPCISEMAPEVGFEPTTNRLTADRSTTELLRSVVGQDTNRDPVRFKIKMYWATAVHRSWPKPTFYLKFSLKQRIQKIRVQAAIPILFCNS